MLTYVPFSAIIQFFFRVPLNVLLRTRETNPTPGWESLLYGIIVKLMRLFSEPRRYESCHIALTWCNSGTIQKCPFAVYAMSSKNNNYLRQYWDTFKSKHTPIDRTIVGCSCHISQLNRSIIPNGQCLDCDTIAFGERCILLTPTVAFTKPASGLFDESSSLH